MNDSIGWIANIFFVIGMILIAHKNIQGFAFNMIGNALYIFVGSITQTYSLSAISIFLVCVNIYGIWKWKNQ